ncbi:MAG: nitrous oxide reductase accessory protein NosL [Flavobacterium sp.]
MEKVKISLLSKVILLIVTGLFFGSLYFPMWQIDLDAPQYPEGLVLKLYAHKIGGDIEIINGLNHYIGMATLHTENFIEFKILPYIIGFFGLMTLLTAIIAKRKGVLALFISLVLFTILAGIDFYRWNYEYGHNLDPSAAIKVPGMAYQPPLIGYKQLLNFGAYSIPDIGGWMLISSGLLLFIILTIEYKWHQRFIKSKTALLIVPFFFLTSCAGNEPQPIKLNVDTCEFCKMPVSDAKFGAQIQTQKGRFYIFDDIACLAKYCQENESTKIKNYYVHDYTQNNQLIDATKAFYINGGDINSPMHGNIAAFASFSDAQKFSTQLKAQTISWDEILK